MTTQERSRIYALTVFRPWSELIANGKKTVECRSWAPPEWMLGRYIAVHASTRWDQEGADFVTRNDTLYEFYQRGQETCPVGIIAVVHLVGWLERMPDGRPRVVQILPGHQPIERDERCFHVGQFGWLLRDVKRIAPVAARGRQKLWEMPRPVYDSVRRRYGKAA